MPNIVLDRKEMDYCDMEKIGRITIEPDPHGRPRVIVDGFEFRGNETCRTHVTKAMAWARDVLATAVQADRLIPGGNLATVRGVDQEELESEWNEHA